MSENLANLIRDMYDDLYFLMDYVPKYIIEFGTKTIGKMSREEMERNLITILQEMKKHD